MNEITIFQREGAVTCDFAGVKSQIEAQMKLYDGVVFTEDTKTDAKKTVAAIRKDKKEFLDRVKEAKEMYMKPWNKFYDQACEIANLFDRPVNYINEQIDAFEETRKREKDEKIKTIFGELVFEPEILEYLPLSRVYSDRWLNATYTEKQIKDDIMTAKIEVKEALKVIGSFDTTATAKALSIYKETLNLAEAITYLNNFEREKKEILATEQARVKEEVLEQFVPNEGGEEKPILYTIYLTADAKQKLETFMDSVGITYREE